jgi:hypothetical protein
MNGQVDLHFNVRHADNDIFELVMFPGVCRLLDHSHRSVVLNTSSASDWACIPATYVFVIFDVQEDQFWPQVCRQRCLDDLPGDVKINFNHASNHLTFGMLMRATNNLRCSITMRRRQCAPYRQADPRTFRRSVLAVQDSEFREDTHLQDMRNDECVRSWEKLTWARSRLNPASNNDTTSSKCPRCS